MNRIVKSRTIRIPCSAVYPAAEDPALSLPKGPASPVMPALPSLPALSPSTALRINSAEGSAVEGSLAQATELERARGPHPGRHARLCSVCNHPDRDAIEEAFIHWHHPFDIACDYNLPDRSSVYRHAHATGLFALRSRNLCFVLENLLERVDRVKVTAHAVIRAVRAYTRINNAGEWIDPPTRIVVSSVSPSPPPLPALPALSRRQEGQGEGSKARRLRSGRICGAQAKPRSNRHKGLQSR